MWLRPTTREAIDGAGGVEEKLVDKGDLAREDDGDERA